MTIQADHTGNACGAGTGARAKLNEELEILVRVARTIPEEPAALAIKGLKSVWLRLRKAITRSAA